MSKSQEAMDMFRANKDASVKEVAEKTGITVAHAYALRRQTLGPVYKKRKRGKAVLVEHIKKEAEVVEAQDSALTKLTNSNILLGAQLNDALRELEDCRAVIRYLEKKIADAV